MKIAIYKSVRGNEMIFQVDSWIEESEEYVRITDIADVEFLPLSASAVIEKQVAMLDIAEQELRKQFAVKLDEIQHEREKLRALTYTPEVA